MTKRERVELANVARHVKRFYRGYSFEPAEPSGYAVLHNGEVIGVGETPLDAHRVIIVHAGEVEPKEGRIKLKGFRFDQNGLMFSSQPMDGKDT